jgi:hypothetical protein
MRSIRKNVAIAAAGLLLVPQIAAAADLETEVADMKQRMEVMEDQLRTQSDDLAAAKATVEKQNEVIEQAGLEEREEVSALSAFIEQVDFGSFVAASYNYNFRGTSDPLRAPFGCDPTLTPPAANSCTIVNQPGTQNNNFNQGIANGGQLARIFYPQHANPNTFQLDQAWISIDKAPTEESRAGMHMDVVAGNGFTSTPVGSDAIGLYSAYVSYLAPIGPGLQIDAGIMPTIIGWEVENANGNWNITRGNSWGLQPVTSTGFLASMEVVEGITVMAGMLNDPIVREALDTNKAKALTAKVAYEAEKFGASVGINWGRAGNGLNGNVNQSQGILDVILWADPLDNLSAYINYDYRFEDNRWASDPYGVFGLSSDLAVHAVAVAARLGVLDNMGVAVRYEFIHSDDQTPVGQGGLNGSTVANLLQFDGVAVVQSVTGTVDYGLTDNLTLKTEVRYDHANPRVFANKDGLAGTGTAPFDITGHQSQIVALAQLIYEF